LTLEFEKGVLNVMVHVIGIEICVYLVKSWSFIILLTGWYAIHDYLRILLKKQLEN